MIREVIKVMCFLFKTFITLLTFRFEIVEPTVTPEEAERLKELIESLMNENADNCFCQTSGDSRQGSKGKSENDRKQFM